MAGKEDLIIKMLGDMNGQLMTISGDIGGIKQHLENLNSKVATQERRINDQDDKIDSIKATVYGMIGGLGVIIFLIQVFA